ncbi:unnamed protein product, partial [Mesorhabditis belari]|uniref:Cysteine dioxygenase n=1 Tax=Mesorhabditis belari TaxID=2138241 RepID=A0AAF3FEU5_9BILA
MSDRPITFDQMMEVLQEEVRGVRNEDGSIQNEVSMKNRAAQILKGYDAAEGGWRKYEFWDPKRMKYYRNLVARWPGCQAIILCWPEGIISPIHDHSNSSCFVKVFQGKLLETRYKMPTRILDESEKTTVADRCRMEEIGKTEYALNDVSYMTDEQGLHSMHNPSHSEGAISLHLYFPSFTHCRCFNEETSLSHEGEMLFHTEQGQKTKHFGAQ